MLLSCLFFFFFNDTATTEIYTLSLHDALPISCRTVRPSGTVSWCSGSGGPVTRASSSSGESGVVIRYSPQDRKSTRLNSSHGYISYAVFCLKKKKNKNELCQPLPATAMFVSRV